MTTLSRNLQVGWAMRDVTTTKPITIPGQFHLRVSQEVLDPITLTALAISNEEDVVIFLSADILMIREYLLDKIRSRLAQLDPSIPIEKILMNATHTHTGPDTSGGILEVEGVTPSPDHFRHDGIEIASSAEYCEFFVNQAAEAVIEAWKSRAPGGITYGYGFAVVGHSRRVVYFDDISLRPGAEKNSRHGVNGHTSMYGNTNDPMFSHYEAGSDPFINLLYTFDPQGKLTGAIINVPSSAQSSETERRLSAAFWHEAREAIRSKHGNIFILPQYATGGDLSPRPLHYQAAQARRFALKYGADHNPRNIKEYEQRCDIAERISNAFDEVLAWARKDIQTSLPLKHLVSTVHLSKRLVTREIYEEAKRDLAELNREPFKTEGTPIENLEANSILVAGRNRLKQVISRYENQQKEPKLPMELHVLRIGNVAFASNRFELFTDFQHRIQARSPFVQTFIVQLAGVAGKSGGTYLATERGVWGKGYGASIFCNLVSPEGGQELVEETLKQLHILSSSESKT